ncbi:hypothetical protein RND71_028236 [Anisodus tanguticus]|uniref:Uncharacterized protein n=1 Tax=Anisodus tanguticus TaxID=243964 RepID=A0AAE1V1E3_9SOLA|nr:hypothetical protein RND71_028236 [Anisodus tanguticus]
MLLGAAVCCVWRERNQRIFQHKRQNQNLIIKLIIQEVHQRANTKPKLTKWLSNFNFYPV